MSRVYNSVVVQVKRMILREKYQQAFIGCEVRSLYETKLSASVVKLRYHILFSSGQLVAMCRM